MNLIESPDHSSRGHHPLGPSGTNYRDPRVGGCLGFINRQNEDNQAADEGTENHEIMDLAARQWVRNKCEGSIVDYFSGEITDQAASWLSYVSRQVEDIILTADEVHPELMVELKDDAGGLVNFGHLDLLCISGPLATLDDYKFGWVPVKPAIVNRQGWNYTAAVFQMFPQVQEINVRFIQPKLSWTTEHRFSRTRDADRLRVEIMEINRQSLEVRESMDVDKLNPGSACEYCALKGTCPGYLNLFDLGRAKTGMLPDLPEWSAAAIDTPEKAAAARAWADVFESTLPEVKKRCLEMAKELGEIRSGSWAWKVAQRRGPGTVPDLQTFLDTMGHFGITPDDLKSAMSISKDKAVKTAVDLLKKGPRSKDTKKALADEVNTVLQATGAYEEGEQYEYLKQIKKQN